MPTCGSLFSGIGGLDLGLERAGFTVRWQVELDAFCQRVLAKHWPDVPRHGDVRTFPGPDTERVDLICGGFPCQPVSVAGKRRAQADERWLWPEFARVVRELRPRLVLVENVPGLLVRGMGDVLGDLAACGYDAEWDCIPAVAVGAPHRRDRVWLVAYARGERCGWITNASAGNHANGDHARWSEEAGVARTSGEVADATPDGRESRGAGDATEGARGRESYRGGECADISDAERIGLEGVFARRAAAWATLGDGGWWATEPDVGRVAHGVPARVDRLRGLGNAVVPQVAEWIGHRLMNALARPPLTPPTGR